MTFKDFIGSGTTGIIGLLNTLVVPVIFAFAFAAFVWGVMRYFYLNGGDDGKRAEGRTFVLWGLIGMAVLFSVWGFVNIMLSTLGIAPS
ncbi:MAG: hypothetical protein WC217_02510 [Candidatus Paceibacterota bacterium]|jgi:hypothetical protein